MSVEKWYDEYKKKKKKKEDSPVLSWYNSYKGKSNNGDDIAPAVSSGRNHGGGGGSFAKGQTNSKPKWFQGGAFSDGYQFGDISKTVIGTVADVSDNVNTAVIDATENLIDTASYGVGAIGGIFNEGFRDSVGEFIGREILQPTKTGEGITKFTNPIGWANELINGGETEGNSLLGDKADGLVQSAAHLAGSAALERVGVPSWLTMGVNAFGSEIESAFQQDATYLEAGISGAVSAVAEVVFEKISSGIKFKGGTLDDGFQKTLTKNISDRITRSILKYGSDMLAEGGEEVLTEGVSALGRKLTYMDDKKFNEIFSSEDAFDAFIGGVVMSGGMGGGRIVKSATSGTDYTSGLTANDEKVVLKLYEEALAETRKNGIDLNKAQRDKLYDSIVEDMSKGQLKIDDIERVLGGDTYKAYQDVVKSEDAILKEYEELGKKQQPTLADQSRYSELKSKVDEIKSSSKKAQLKSQLSQEVFDLVQSDKTGRLAESYREVERRKVVFKADLTKYKSEYAKKTVQNAIAFGINDTKEAHDFLDLATKLAEDKKYEVVFTSTKSLEESKNNGNPYNIEEDADPKDINAFVSESQRKIIVNMDTKKSLSSLVGHEITDTLRQDDGYDKLKSFAFAYAESKGELKARRESVNRRYKNIVADLEGELTSDIVGDYLFTDEEFVRKLSVENRNLFQKVYDGVKYMYRLATAGSKQARALERLKHQIEKIWRENSTGNVEKKSDTETKYSLAQTDEANAVTAEENALKTNYQQVSSIKYNYGAVESHKKSLAKNITVDSSVDLDTIMQRYDKILKIWEKLGGELDSRFLNDWNNKTERPFTIFKKQSGYKYNVELSSMCKKGVPLFEAIDTIVKKEVMKELGINTIGKEEKEILYDILKQHDFEIPCAICYVEQARQREGAVINAFLNGNEDGKLGWNKVLDSIEDEMNANGVFFRFPNVSRDIATDKYDVADSGMDESTSQAFYSAVQKIANEEIKRYNQTNGKNRKLLRNTTPEAVKDCFSGGLPSNLKIFKTLLTEPSSRFRLEEDLLYSSLTTRNLASSHHALYSLFNSQGGVSGYKTKQGTTIYWGEILGKKWKPSVTRSEGGVRNQSNSDLQAYTILDHAQMFMDFTAKGYYLQAYTKVISELKLFGLSKGKINASLIPRVKVYYDVEGNVDVQRTMENAGLDENGNPIYDDIEGINHSEAFMLIDDAEYSKNICGICIGYSDKHILKLLDDDRVQLIIGYHDKTNDTDKRYRGARYAKNYNGLNEAVNRDGKTVHLGFNKYVSKAEKRFSYNADTEAFEGVTTFNGKKYRANDIPRLAADMYLDMCSKKGYTPAYDMFKSHRNYYKLLADFGLYDSQGNYAPHRKVEYNMPDTVPYLDENGNKKYIPTEEYIKAELKKELAVRDAIAEALSDKSPNGIIPQFKAEIQKRKSSKYSISEDGTPYKEYGNFNQYAKNITIPSDIVPAKAATDTNVGGKQVGVVKDEITAPIRDDISPAVAENVITDAPIRDDVAPINSIEQRIAENLKALRSELADNIDLRKAAEEDYEEQIANLQKQYISKKNTNTKTAYNLLQRISRLERLKKSNDANFAKRISDLEARIDKMSDPAYSRALHRQAKMQEHAQWAEDLIGDTTTWVDKKLGLQYQTNTERRNLRDIVRDESGNKDIARADAISDALNGRYNREEAAKKREQSQISKKYSDLKITKVESTYIQMLGELRYNPRTSLTQADVNAFYEKHKKQINEDKVDRVIEYARKDYDSLILRLNEKLREQGMREIPYRKGYFPHFTEPKQNFIQKLLNWKTQNTEIPTSIAGLTETFRPVKKYQSFDKQRHTDTTDYNFLLGFDNYLDGALDWIYHLDTLQKRRAVENYIRYIHSDNGIQARIREIYANEEFDADEAQAQVDHVLAEGKNPLNNFVQDFTTHTNILAGKKNSLDRTIEQATNRHIYSVMTNVQNRMSANMVLANVRSALTNFIPITQSWAQVSPLRSLQATKDTIANAIKDDGMIDKSTFLTNRLRESDRLYQTNWDKVLDKAGIMFDIVDNFSSQVIWRSKYNQNLAKGMTESEAIRNADQFAENVMAGRSKGNEPTLFNAKNPLVKAFTMFQLEVNNQYGYLFKDVPNDLKAETKHWKLNLAKGYTFAFIGANVYNVLMEMLTGSTAAFDPLGIIWELLRDLGLFDDDEEKEPAEIATNLIDNVVEELPFVGGLFGGGRIPISSALPYSDEYDEGLSGFISDVSKGEWKNIGKEMMNPVLNVVLPVAGGQIKKTVQGLRMFNTDEEHPIAGSYTSKGNLRFPVEDTPVNRIQAGLFGQYANENAREYFDNGYAPLKEKQIQEYMDAELPIADYWKYREGLKGLKTNAEKADYINSLDIEDWQKNLLMNNNLDRKEDVDMSNYSDYSGWEEFDFATKNPERYSFLQENGISYDVYNASEDSREAYNWAADNPKGYVVSKAVADDVVTYKRYTRELNKIKADKDENGKSISGSKKDKVVEYIDNLDIDYGAKLVLFKSKYSNDNSYNEDIINYINSREDLSYEERVAIFKKFGFTMVDDTVYTD